jgi:hypothetical protein
MFICVFATHWMTLVDPKFISLTTIHIGKRIKDKKERVFGSASNEHYHYERICLNKHTFFSKFGFGQVGEKN